MLSVAQLRKMGGAFIRQFRITQAYQDVFAGESGELVLYDILAKAGVLKVAMVVGSSDLTIWNDGRRSLALDILATLRWDAQKIVELAEKRDAMAAELESPPPVVN